MTPEQRRRNRIAAVVLVIFVLAVFAWAMFKGGGLFTGGVA
ncbi:hypothetical protein [Bordetella bronchialis]|nr:hypothetical protein [Bordetella bronchialis]